MEDYQTHTGNVSEIDPQEIEEVFDKVEDVSEPKYEFELFLSTDGKQTVHVKAFDAAGKRKALQVATETYDYILERYGTKQAQAVKEYSKPNGEAELNQDTCKHEQVRFAQSKTDKNPGRWFKSCVTCGKFLGWQDGNK